MIGSWFSSINHYIPTIGVWGTLPPTIMVQWKLGPSNISFLSFRAIFTLMILGEKVYPTYTINKTQPPPIHTVDQLTPRRRHVTALEFSTALKSHVSFPRHVPKGNGWAVTLPKTNKAPENRPSQMESSSSNHQFSGSMLVLGSEVFESIFCTTPQVNIMFIKSSWIGATTHRLTTNCLTIGCVSIDLHKATNPLRSISPTTIFCGLVSEPPIF